MDISEMIENNDTDDIFDSGFECSGFEETKFKSETTDIIETQTLNDFCDDDLNTDEIEVDKCEEVSHIYLSDCGYSMSSDEKKEYDKVKIKLCTAMTICDEFLSSAEKTMSSEKAEILSSVKESLFIGRETLDPAHSVEKVMSSSEINYDLLNRVTKVKGKKIICPALSKQEKCLKLKEIVYALENNNVNMLKSAALSVGGLLNDDIRRKVWPKLVGVDLVATAPRPCQEEIEKHPYYQQVVLDVNRSLKRFPPSIHEAQRLTMLDQLVILIMRVLCKHPELHYYQGYHDICVTFLLVLGEETAYHVVERLSLTHLRVFMEQSMEPTIHLLEHMYLLIEKNYPSYKDFLLKSEVGVAYCLSWLITWFSHVLNDYSTVVRFFDFFIVSHSWMPMYVTTSLVLYRQPQVIKQDCDMASVHSFLCHIPDDLPFETLLTDSLQLFKSFKPKQLRKDRPYIQVDKHRKVKQWTFIRKNYYTIPATLVIAAAVLVTAVIYQAYNHV